MAMAKCRVVYVKQFVVQFEHNFSSITLRFSLAESFAVSIMSINKSAGASIQSLLSAYFKLTSLPQRPVNLVKI